LSLSNNARNNSEIEQAYEFAERAHKVLLDLSEKNDVQYQQTLAQAHRMLGLSSRILGSYDIAIKWYRKSLDETRKLEDQRDYAATLNDIGNVYRLRGDLTMARNYVEKGLEIRHDIELKRPDINIKHEINLSLMTLGLVARDKGHIREAVKHFQEAENLARSTNNQLDLAGALRNRGDTLYWREGIFYLEPEHYRRREIADEFDIHVDEESPTHKLLIQGNDYLSESERILRANNRRDELAKTLYARARLHMNLLEWLEAETYLKESLELANEVKDRYLESDNLVTLITLYYFTNIEDENSPYLKQLETLLKNQTFHDLKARLELVLGNIEYDRERYERDEALYQAAFTHYVEACKHMLLHNTQRYQVCLTTLKKRLAAISVPVIRRKVCEMLIDYWHREKLDEKDLGVIQIAELEM
jgi:tetratricopeptide (TPR) repeat protein